MSARIDQDRDALLVVDVQNDFCPGGRLAIPKGDEVLGPVRRAMAAFAHVALTQDWHPSDHLSFASAHPGRRPYETAIMPYGAQILWPDHCVQGTSGADFHPDLDTERAEIVLRKGFRREIDSYSAFFENDRATPTGLGGYLRDRGFRRLFLVGLAFDFCVLWSAEDARRQGFDAVVIEDGCRALDVDGSAADARRRLDAAGVTHLASGEL
jgi:nicotinamidase/pyrazinamidase